MCRLVQIIQRRNLDFIALKAFKSKGYRMIEIEQFLTLF